MMNRDTDTGRTLLGEQSYSIVELKRRSRNIAIGLTWANYMLNSGYRKAERRV
jgi:hypothetical protein